jgi:chromosome segregation ATPase
MRNDEASEPFVNARITEIYDDTLAQEREMTIEKLHKEMVELKGELVASQGESDALRHTISRLEESIRKEEARTELKDRELNDERNRLQQSQSAFEEQLKTKDLEIRAKSEESMIDINSLGLELRKVSDQCEALANTVKSRDSQIASLTQEIEDERVRRRSAESECEQYKSDID